MIDYVFSDMHIDHEQIIEYCDRPFDSVSEMNSELISNWNDTVGSEETVLFLGDLAFGSKENQKSVLSRLDGDIIFVRGNHDDLTMQSGVGVVCTGIEFSVEGISFYASHKPLPDFQFESVRILHGHMHNNNLREYPFYNYHKGRFNFSAELVGYTPVPFADVLDIIRNTNESLMKYSR